MSLISRHSERLSSPFSEVRQGARDELLMIVAGATGVISVIGAITWVVVITVVN
ncbi:hypothetical protein [Mycetocola sp.]|uniref:hypothetical protein n=1 Tax=Mycetocola sp. TaxID=1871042 RepID=UPI0039895B3E